MTTNTPPAPTTPANDELVPRYSASEQPVTRGYRILLQVWMTSALLVVVTALIFFLVDKLIMN